MPFMYLMPFGVCHVLQGMYALQGKKRGVHIYGNDFSYIFWSYGRMPGGGFWYILSIIKKIKQ